MTELIKQTLNKSRATNRPLSIGVYLMILTVIWSPYFTPSGKLDAAGLLRADQILIPVLILWIVVSTLPNAQILTSTITLLLVSIVAVIFLSYIFGILIRSYPASLGDSFDILIWATYAAIIAIIGPAIPYNTARKAILLLIIASVGAAILSLFQYLELFAINSVISPVFTEGIHLTRVARRSTGPTGNPNVLAQLLSMPLLVAFALLVRSIGESFRNPETSFQNLALILIICILSAGVYVTFSRSGAVSTVVGMGYIATVYTFSNIGSKRARHRFITFGVLATITIIIIITLGAVDLGRFANLTNITADSSFRARLRRWDEAIIIIKKALIIGHGPSEIGLRNYQYTYIDSGFLSWWYHYGLIGVALFIGLLTTTLANLTRIMLLTEVYSKKPVVWGAAAATAGWCLGALFVWPVMTVGQTRRTFTLFLILLGLIIGGYYNDSVTGELGRDK